MFAHEKMLFGERIIMKNSIIRYIKWIKAENNRTNGDVVVNVAAATAVVAAATVAVVAAAATVAVVVAAATVAVVAAAAISTAKKAVCSILGISVFGVFNVVSFFIGLNIEWFWLVAGLIGIAEMYFLFIDDKPR